MDIATTLLVLATIGNFSMGLLVYIRNKTSEVNKFFGVLAIILTAWCVSMIFFRNNLIGDYLIWGKILYGVAAIVVFSLLSFTFVFPSSDKRPKLITRILMLLGAITIAYISIATNLIVVDVVKHSSGENIIKFGSGYYIYAVYIVVYVGVAIANMFFKMLQSDGTQRMQIKYFFVGMAISALTSLIFNLTLPTIGVYNFQWFGQVSTFIMLGFMTYAIMKLHLLQIKIVAAELFTFAIWIFILVRTLLADAWEERIINGSFLVFVTFFGILLVKSVFKEVRAREEIEQLATKLEFANLRLRQLDEAKSDFISIASHQLRTPLTAIKGYASLILEGSFGNVTKKMREPVERILQSSQRLVIIIGDFLDVSHIERGTMDYNFEKTDLREMLSGLSEEFQASLAKMEGKDKNLKVLFKADPDADFSVKVDKNTIRQVFSNLIDNSIKYTEKGFVKIFLYRNEENGRVTVKIEDSGIGIAKDVLPNLFRKFVRAKGHASLHANGSGLGLYVAKEIIKAHHGRIWAESEGDGKGSRFLVEFS